MFYLVALRLRKVRVIESVNRLKRKRKVCIALPAALVFEKFQRGIGAQSRHTEIWTHYATRC